jgi:aminoglycoside/choline kinase family phosphotransferase
LEQLVLEKLFRRHFGQAVESITPLKGDGSDRRIYRLKSSTRSVIGIMGDHRAENEAFIKFSRHFYRHGLPVPEIYATHLDEGIYLEQDLGYETLFEWMSRIREKDGFSEQILDLYRQTLAWLPHFQITAGQSLDYSYCYQHASFAWDSMQWDLQYFRHRFLELFYKRPLDKTALQKDFDNLVHFLLEEKADFFLYRDFQSRNVMVVDNKPYFIDYQSGRRGALQYDVASLLYDAKANIPEKNRQELLMHYISSVNKVHPIDADRFMRYFYGFVLIRIMQAFGAYGYLAGVRGKKRFLKSVPFAISNIELLLTRDTFLKNTPTLCNIFEALVTDSSLREF